MFDQRNDPVHLLHSLQSFLQVWHYEPPGWHGIAAEKLAETPLPDPLRRLYAFAGHWPGDNFWYSPFAHQDYLVPFELLLLSEGRLLFAGENQGCWTCCTEPEGDDPPVWFREGRDQEWQLLGDSLAQFLVTICLHETVFGAAYKGTGKGLVQRFRDTGRHVAPLWLKGKYPPPFSDRSFHYTRQVLIMDDWCATNNPEIAESLPDVFKPLTQTSTEFSGKPLWEFSEIPLVIRQNMLRMKAQQHQDQADFHAQRAAGFREMQEKLVQ